MRQNASWLVRRAEAGDQVTITVAGRLAAALGPSAPRAWRQWAEVSDLFRRPRAEIGKADRESLDDAPADPGRPVSRGILDTSALIAADLQPLPGEPATSVISLAELHYGILVAQFDDARAVRLARLVGLQKRFDPCRRMGP